MPGVCGWGDEGSVFAVTGISQWKETTEQEEGTLDREQGQHLMDRRGERAHSTFTSELTKTHVGRLRDAALRFSWVFMQKCEFLLDGTGKSCNRCVKSLQRQRVGGSLSTTWNTGTKVRLSGLETCGCPLSHPASPGYWIFKVFVFMYVHVCEWQNIKSSASHKLSANSTIELHLHPTLHFLKSPPGNCDVQNTFERTRGWLGYGNSSRFPGGINGSLDLVLKKG